MYVLIFTLSKLTKSVTFFLGYYDKPMLCFIPKQAIQRAFSFLLQLKFQIKEALKVIQTFETKDWKENARNFRDSIGNLTKEYPKKRTVVRVRVNYTICHLEIRFLYLFKSIMKFKLL